jgi:hypothetical protein
MSEEQVGRWTELLDGVAGMLPSTTACVVVDGGPHAAVVADRLAGRLRTGGRACTFHPSGRAALAARHGRTLNPEEPLAEGRLGEVLAVTGWRLDTYDDPDDRFLTLATRRRTA